MHSFKFKHFKFEKIDSKGQLSLFFAITVVFAMTCLAFVVNVGLFVKAKINLQNAVDAAAYSGAATQARQISNIAYLNYEMRNNYKEWMFKYYILGQLANPKVSPTGLNGQTRMDFRLRTGMADATGSGAGATSDLFNVPSICIKPSGIDQSNICAVYHVPGIPRFPPLGLTGVDDTINEFTSAVVAEKSKDCTARSQMNFVTALIWAYGASTSSRGSILDTTIKIAWERPGAYINALELALRIRNLEKMVNIPPAQNVCAGSGNCNPIQQFHQSGGDSPARERTVKAFWSAYRNLENNDGQMDLKRSFRLTEIPPVPTNAENTNLNGYFIPTASTPKYYLDLYVNLVNVTTFYTMFMTRTGSVSTGTGTANIEAEAACPGIKTALPVPSFPIGFFKNPEVLTYYAVKGEADYIGIMNPFISSIKMTAYAAAKPFGGRIGPMLFRITKDDQATLYPRSTSSRRSAAYISAIKSNPVEDQKNNDYLIGYPIPIDSGKGVDRFWAQNASDAIGGKPKAGVYFSIPNLLYDILNIGMQSGPAMDIQIITAEINQNTRTYEAGLYASDQYLAFRKNIPESNVVGPPEIAQAIWKARSPTLYEALNYLIPTRETSASSPAFIPPDPSAPLVIYAPLFSDDPNVSYYKREDIRSIINDHLNNNKMSINTYMDSMKKVRNGILKSSEHLKQTELGSNKNNYVDAGNNLYNDGANECKSIAGKFLHFFYGPACPNEILFSEAVQRYWLAQSATFGLYYNSTYVGFQSGSGDEKLLMTAYLPGPSYGATPDGILPHPFMGDQQDNFNLVGDRNTYSTKFIPLASLTQGGANGQNSYLSTGFTSYSERSFTPPDDVLNGGLTGFINPINSGELQKGGLPKKIRPIRE